MNIEGFCKKIAISNKNQTRAAVVVAISLWIFAAFGSYKVFGGVFALPRTTAILLTSGIPFFIFAGYKSLQGAPASTKEIEVKEEEKKAAPT